VVSQWRQAQLGSSRRTRVQGRLERSESVVLEHVQEGLHNVSALIVVEEPVRLGSIQRTVLPALSRPRNRSLAPSTDQRGPFLGDTIAGGAAGHEMLDRGLLLFMSPTDCQRGSKRVPRVSERQNDSPSWARTSQNQFCRGVSEVHR
jgi:hypothetical protein